MLNGTPFQAPTELALAGPGSVGEKVKDIWQDCPGSRVMPWQFWTPLKGAPGAPPTPDIATGAAPVFVIVTVCGGEVVPTGTSPNSSAVGVTRNRGPAPVPLSAMLKGTPFQAPTELALAGPGSVGEKVKDIWQDWPGSRVMPWQFWTPLKGAPGAPPTPDIATGAVPVFVIVTVC
jgi:hypothetical protein